jgi:HK97 family phage portal protein
MKSPFGALAQAIARNAGNQPPIAYARTGFTPNNLMQGGADPAAYMRAYGANGTVFAIVSMLARQTAKKDWHLYRQQPQDGRRRYSTADKGSDQRTEVLQHQAMSVWHKPNAFMTGFMLREISQTYLDTTGESYLIVQRDGRATFPTGLWPVRPDRMEPVPHTEKFLAGYIYSGPSGEAVPLQPDEVIMTKYPNPYDIYHGLGPIQAVLVDIDSAKYSAQWNRNFFLNSATPGGVIQVDKRLGDDEWNEFTNRWRESHRGMGAAHRVAVLEQGAVWVPNAHSQRDMDYMNLRNVSRDVIREAFAMHKAILGTTDDVNRANAQTAQELFESFLVTDRLDRWRDVLNCFYLPLFGSSGEGVEMDHDDAITSNREADALELKEKAAAAQTLVAAGFEPHAVLETVGLPDMEVVEKAAQAPALPPGWVPTAAPAEPDAPPAVKPANRARALPRAAAPATSVDLSEMDAQHTAATDQLTADYATQITPQQREQVLAQIRELVAAGTIGALGAIVLNHAAAKLLILAAMTRFGHTSAQQASTEAQRQGAAAPPVQPQQANLDAVAEATAALLAAELALAAGREAARAAGGSAAPDPDAVAEHVGQFLDGLSSAGRDGQLAGALAAAQNQARHATFTAGPRCELMASEWNDANTCGPCELIDGHSFGYSDEPDAVASAAAAYPTSGYIACEGRDRCRGALAADYTGGSEPSDRDAPFFAALPAGIGAGRTALHDLLAEQYAWNRAGV